MFALKHEVFAVGAQELTFRWWNVRADALRKIDLVRSQAEEFAGRIGAENVVTVIERGISVLDFTLILWYREEQETGAKKPARDDEFFEAPAYR